MRTSYLLLMSIAAVFAQEPGFDRYPECENSVADGEPIRLTDVSGTGYDFKNITVINQLCSNGVLLSIQYGVGIADDGSKSYDKWVSANPSPLECSKCNGNSLSEAPTAVSPSTSPDGNTTTTENVRYECSDGSAQVCITERTESKYGFTTIAMSITNFAPEGAPEEISTEVAEMDSGIDEDTGCPYVVQLVTDSYEGGDNNGMKVEKQQRVVTCEIPNGFEQRVKQTTTTNPVGGQGSTSQETIYRSTTNVDGSTTEYEEIYYDTGIAAFSTITTLPKTGTCGARVNGVRDYACCSEYGGYTCCDRISQNITTTYDDGREPDVKISISNTCNGCAGSTEKTEWLNGKRTITNKHSSCWANADGCKITEKDNHFLYDSGTSLQQTITDNNGDSCEVVPTGCARVSFTTNSNFLASGAPNDDQSKNIKTTVCKSTDAEGDHRTQTTETNPVVGDPKTTVTYTLNKVDGSEFERKTTTVYGADEVVQTGEETTTVGGGETVNILPTQSWSTSSQPACPYTEWTEWGACSMDCGEGAKTRSRQAVDAGGVQCVPLPQQESEPCDGQGCACVVDDWSEYSECSISCGTGGVQTMTRNVITPAQVNYNGPECKTSQSKPCDAPISCDCTYNEWAEWSACSQDCEEGLHSRSRTQVPTFPDCIPQVTDEEGVCNNYGCPCVIGEWQAYGECSVTCGVGLHTREKEVVRLAQRNYDGPECEVPREEAPCTAPMECEPEVEILPVDPNDPILIGDPQPEILPIEMDMCDSGVPEDISKLSMFEQRGVLGKYYPDTAQAPPAFSPPLVADIHFDRIDAGINIDVGREAVNDLHYFHHSVHNHNLLDQVFIRWEGRIIFPCAGNYTFGVRGDDGVKLDMDGVLLIDDWTLHAARLTEGESHYYPANSVKAVRVDFFEGGGHLVCELLWLRPGATEFEIVPAKYLVPGVGAEVLVTEHNVITINGHTHVQHFEVALSTKPTETVRVAVDNIAGQDIFGVDKCELVFTPENWETPQRVHVAPVLSSPSVRRIEGTMYISLTPDSDAFSANQVMVTDPEATGSKAPGKMCVGWGDPHYTSYDGLKFDLFHQGMFTFTRDYKGNFGIQTYLEPCDQVGATVGCTFNGYIRYADTDIQLSMNTEDLWDPKVYFGMLRGTGDGIVFDQQSDDVVVFTLPSGVTAKVTTGFYRTERTDGTHWRYLNFYVTAPGSLGQQLYGLCGDFDGVESNDVGDSEQLNTMHLIENEDDWILYGGRFAPKENPNAFAAEEGAMFEDEPEGYVSPMDYNDFVFAQQCNPFFEGKEPISTLPISPPITPRALNPDYVPELTYSTTEVPDDILQACQGLLDSVACPMFTPDLAAFHLRACGIDTVKAEMTAPTIDVFAAFEEECNFGTIDCEACTPEQKCDLSTGRCLDASDPCGNSCGANGACVGGICECQEGYIGEFCSVLLSPCSEEPCENGGKCTEEGLEYTCTCTADYMGSNCQTPVILIVDPEPEIFPVDPEVDPTDPEVIPVDPVDPVLLPEVEPEVEPESEIDPVPFDSPVDPVLLPASEPEPPTSGPGYVPPGEQDACDNKCGDMGECLADLTCQCYNGYSGALCDVAPEIRPRTAWSQQAEQLTMGGASTCCARKKAGLLQPSGVKLIKKPGARTSLSQSDIQNPGAQEPVNEEPAAEEPTYDNEFVLGSAGMSCTDVCTARDQVCNVENTVNMVRSAWTNGGGADGVKAVIEEKGGVCPNGANNQDYYSLPGVGNGNCEISNNYGTADGEVMFNCLGKFDTVERLCFCNTIGFVASEAAAGDIPEPVIEEPTIAEEARLAPGFVLGAAGEHCDTVCGGRDQVCNVDTTVSKLREAWSTGGGADGIKAVMEAEGGSCPNGANNQDYYSLPGIGNGNCEISNNYGTANGDVMFNCLGFFDTVQRLCYCSDSGAPVEDTIEPVVETFCSSHTCPANHGLVATAQSIECNALTGCDDATCCEDNGFALGAPGEHCDTVCLKRGQVCDVDTTVAKFRAAWSSGGGAEGIKTIMEANGGTCPNGANDQDYYSLPGIGNGNCEISNNYGTANGAVMFNCLGAFNTVERLCYCSDAL